MVDIMIKAWTFILHFGGTYRLLPLCKCRRILPNCCPLHWIQYYTRKLPQNQCLCNSCNFCRCIGKETNNFGHGWALAQYLLFYILPMMKCHKFDIQLNVMKTFFCYRQKFRSMNIFDTWWIHCRWCRDLLCPLNSFQLFAIWTFTWYIHGSRVW